MQFSSILLSGVSLFAVLAAAAPLKIKIPKVEDIVQRAPLKIEVEPIFKEQALAKERPVKVERAPLRIEIEDDPVPVEATANED